MDKSFGQSANAISDLVNLKFEHAEEMGHNTTHVPSPTPSRQETTMTAICFGTSITTDELTGRVLAAYFHIRKGHAHETREFGDGAVLADYNNRG